MNRKIATIIVIVFTLSFVSFMIFSTLTSKEPLEEEFYGIVSKIRPMYPSKIVVNFENQSETYYMINEREAFLKLVNIGDSLSKPVNDKYIYVFKLEGNKFVESRKFIFK